MRSAMSHRLCPQSLRVAAKHHPNTPGPPRAWRPQPLLEISLQHAEVALVAADGPLQSVQQPFGRVEKA